MSLRLRGDQPPASGLIGRLPESVRSRVPIQRVPQPRENRMTASWRQAKPARIARSLAVSQAQNSGGWYVAGKSADVGREQSVATLMLYLVEMWHRYATGGRAPTPALRRRRLTIERMADVAMRQHWRA